MPPKRLLANRLEGPHEHCPWEQSFRIAEHERDAQLQGDTASEVPNGARHEGRDVSGSSGRCRGLGREEQTIIKEVT